MTDLADLPHLKKLERDKLKMRAWRAANPEKVLVHAKASNGKWRQANPEKHRARCKAWYEANHAKALEISRASKRRNPATVRRNKGQPEPLRARPAICERDGCTRAAIALDHCHITGKFRGWLCRRCNAAIGLLGDDIAAVRGALAYLEAVK